MKHSSFLRRGLAVTAALSVLGFGVLESAPGGGGKNHGLRQRIRERICAQLDLTDAQRQQIKSIREENLPVLKPKFEQLATERAAMRELIHTTPVNEAAIRAQSAKVAAIEADLAVYRAKTMERISGILTPEQLTKAKEMRAKHAERTKNRIERRGERLGKKGDTL